jgi:hypothetical protein
VTETRMDKPRDNLNLGRDSSDISLLAGGPAFQFLRRMGLCDDTLARVRQGVVVIPLLAWLPLLLLCAFGGSLISGRVAVPFLSDLEVHVRFLLVLPMLIAAEPFVQRGMRPIRQEFEERNLIPKSAMPRFEDAIRSAPRLRRARLPEIVLIAFVYSISVFVVWRQDVAMDSAAWYSGEGSKLSLAGMWYRYVSLPILQFVLCRWYFRLFLWARFLWQVSRIDLSLNPAHPDRVAGLGFIADKANAFAVLALSLGSLLAAHLCVARHRARSAACAVQSRDCCHGDLCALHIPRPAPCVLASAFARGPRRPPRIWNVGREICARTRLQVAS